MTSDIRPRATFTCDRCGFTYQAGFIWIVNRQEVYVCHSCQAVLDERADAIAKGPIDRIHQMDLMIRRLGIRNPPRSESPLRTNAAGALLGFRE